MPNPTRQTGPERTPRNGLVLVSEGLGALVRVARGKDSRQAVAAAVYLVEYGERLIQQQASVSPQPVAAFQQSRKQILDELKGLYAKALGPGTPLVVEADTEPAEAHPPARERF